jgi:hypothetical protein
MKGCRFWYLKSAFFVRQFAESFAAHLAYV